LNFNNVFCNYYVYDLKVEIIITKKIVHENSVEMSVYY
jgi:hypothetical protein